MSAIKTYLVIVTRRSIPASAEERRELARKGRISVKFQVCELDGLEQNLIYIKCKDATAVWEVEAFSQNEALALALEAAAGNQNGAKLFKYTETITKELVLCQKTD